MLLELEDITSGNTTSKINSNWKKIEKFINDYALDRTVTTGEANEMWAELDLGGRPVEDVVGIATVGWVEETYNIPFPTYHRIGDIIITGEDILTNFSSLALFDLLTCDGVIYDPETYPELLSVIGTPVLPDIEDAVGSPFPYKIVADYTGG